MLIIAEVFIPGGIAGVFGAVALLAAMGLGLAIFPPPWGLFSAVAMVVFGGIFILLWVQVFPRTRAGRRLADGGYRYDYTKCTGCGTCYEQCPVHAIEMIKEHE